MNDIHPSFHVCTILSRPIFLVQKKPASPLFCFLEFLIKKNDKTYKIQKNLKGRFFWFFADDKSMETMLEFLDKIETDLPRDETRHKEEAHLT